MKAASRPGVARSRSLMPTPRHCPRPRTVPPSSPRAAESALSLTPLGYRLVGGGGVAWPIDLSRRLRWGDRPPQWSPGPPRKSARSIAADPHLPSCGRPLSTIRIRLPSPTLLVLDLVGINCCPGCVSPMHFIVGDDHCSCGDTITVHMMHNTFCLFRMHFVVGVSLSREKRCRRALAVRWKEKHG
jgi:hypothetical protein